MVKAHALTRFFEAPLFSPQAKADMNMRAERLRATNFLQDETGSAATVKIPTANVVEASGGEHNPWARLTNRSFSLRCEREHSSLCEAVLLS